MRRRAGGVLLPACILVVFSTAGVAAVIRVAGPSGPPRPRGHGQSDLVGDGDARVAVLDPTPSPRPSPAPTPSRSATPTPSASSETGVRPTATAAAGHASEATAPCRPGSVQLRAVAATYVDQAAPAKSFGPSTKLFVAGRDKQRNRRALVAFRLPALPQGCAVSSAALRMTATQASGRRVAVSATRGRWWESNVTWSTAPAATGVTSVATLRSTTATWDVLRQVAGVSSGSVASFVLRDTAESSPDGGQSAFSGRGSGDGPSLTLRWA